MRVTGWHGELPITTVGVGCPSSDSPKFSPAICVIQKNHKQPLRDTKLLIQAAATHIHVGVTEHGVDG